MTQRIVLHVLIPGERDFACVETIWVRDLSAQSQIDLLALYDKYGVALGTFRPGERYVGKRVLEALAPAADLHHEQTSGVEMSGGLEQYPAHQVEAVAAAGQCDTRFVAVLARQAPHCCSGDVRRIGDDQVVMSSAERGKHV